MKKIGVILLFVAMVSLCIIANNEWVGKYSKVAVVKANYNGWILAQDSDGKYYEFDDKEHTFEIGDNVEIKLSDNGTTETKQDDKIIRVVKLK